MKKNSARYKLAEDIFANFDSDELLQLYRLLFLYYELLPPASVGYQLQKILGDYLQHERGEANGENFFWRPDNISNVRLL